MKKIIIFTIIGATILVAGFYAGGWMAKKESNTQIPEINIPNQTSDQTFGSTVLAPFQGGTGIASYSVGEMLYASGPATLSRLLASGSEGQVLKMISGIPTWGTDETGAAGEVHGLLNSDYFNDVLTASVSQGSLIIGNSTPKWSKLDIGASQSFLMSNGTTAFWADYVDKDTTYTASNPLSISGSNIISIDYASASGGGYLTNTDWTTFNNKQSALTFSNPLSNVGNTIYIDYASASGNGYLTSTDWTTFNNKWDSLGDISLTRGSIIRGSSTNVGEAYGIGASGSFLMSDGTDVLWNDIGTLSLGSLTTTTLSATHASISDDFQTLNGIISSASINTLNVLGTVNLPANSITEAMIDINTAPADNYILYYNSAAGKLDYITSTASWDTNTTYTFSNPLSLGGTGVSIDLASASGGGYLTNTDWTTFNNKWDALGDISLTRGSLIRGSSGNVGEALSIGASGSFVGSNGTDTLFVNQTGNLEIYGTASISSTLWVGGAITGSLSGNASTATALAANGANCPAGQYPLGVDASGAVESCTADANTTYTATNPLSLVGTIFYIDYASSSGGGYLKANDYSDIFGHIASVNEHINWTHSSSSFETDNTASISGAIYLGSLKSCDTIDTDANGLLSCGTDATGAGSNTYNNPLSLVGTNVYIDLASASGGGYISSTDWTTFNNKQAAITDGTNLTFSGTTLNVDDPFTIVNLNTTHASISDDLEANKGQFASLSATTLNFPTDSITEANISFSTTCGSGNHLYISGTNLACEQDANTTYTATNPLSLVGTAFNIDYASASGGGYLTYTNWEDFNGKLSSLSIDTSAELATILTDETGTAGKVVFSTSPEFTTSFTTTGAFAINPGGALTIGDGGDTLYINSSDWDISITGDMTGIGAITADGLFTGTHASLSGDLDIVGDLNVASATFATLIGTSSIQLPAGTSITLDANGEAGVDTSGGQFNYYSDEVNILMATMSVGFNLGSTSFEVSPIANYRFDEPVTIVEIDCLVDGGTSQVFEVEECDANGANCVDVDSAITCGTTNTSDDGSLSNPTIDAGDWIQASVSQGDTTGEVDWLLITIYYKWTAQ